MIATSMMIDIHFSFEISAIVYKLKIFYPSVKIYNDLTKQI